MNFYNPKTKVDFDYYATSICLDLGDELDVNSVILTGKKSRIKGEYLELYASLTGNEDSYSKIDGVLFTPTVTGLKAVLKKSVKTRFIKVHSTWDERDEDYKPVNKAEVHGELADLVEVNYTKEGKTNNWTYDAKGNRLLSDENIDGKMENVVAEYFPNSDFLKKYGNWNFTYDKNGNLISKVNDNGESWNYEYDLCNRMVKVSCAKDGINFTESANYLYDYRSLCVKKSTEGYDEYYEYTSDGRLVYTERDENNISQNSQTVYVWAQNTLWAEIQGEDVYYHHTDHLGTTECITDSNGTFVWEASYEAFGKVMNTNGTKSFVPEFTGKRFDEESGLYYFNARWYDSEMGRFTTQDPARDSYNWYAYCSNNPISNTDPTGLKQSKADLEWESIVRKEYESVKNNPELYKEFKSKFSINIYRDKDDNGHNGKYFKSELCVSYCGIPLNSVSVQSTMDWESQAKKEAAGTCGTLSPGIYDGELTAETGKFIDVICINGTGDITDVRIHGNMIDNPKNEKYTGKVYSDGKTPLSLACQVTQQEDKIEINNILKSFGFQFTNSSSKKDHIKVQINASDNPSVYTDRSHTRIKLPKFSVKTKTEPYYKSAK